MRLLVRCAFVALLAALLLVACGLDTGGLLAVAGADAGPDAPTDGSQDRDASASSDASGAHDAPPPPSDAAACTPGDTLACFAVPASWTLVAYATTRPACPTGFDQPTDVTSDPSVPSAACACDGACTLTTTPVCPAQGAIAVHYDLNASATCATTAGALGNTSPTCSTDGARTAVPTGSDTSFTAPAATAGSCTSAPAKHDDRITYASQGLVCVPSNDANAGCQGDVCSPSVAAPFLVCVSQTGDVPCPGAPFTVKHPVETGVTYDCGGTCGCAVTAAPCTGTLKFYTNTDGQCTTGEETASADGVCRPTAGTGQMFEDYTYTPNAASYAYAANGAAQAPSNVQAAGTATVCCAE